MLINDLFCELKGFEVHAITLHKGNDIKYKI
jgi:hypothetical protein